MAFRAHALALGLRGSPHASQPGPRGTLAQHTWKPAPNDHTSLCQCPGHSQANAWQEGSALPHALSGATGAVAQRVYDLFDLIRIVPSLVH
eukprot:784967-Rhodomonas_salina.9